MGVATLIEPQSKPISVIAGNQESFKIEYLDKSITIKPLHAGAKSNLYIYTEQKRFNLELVPESRAGADYVVYLETDDHISPKNNTTKWTRFVSAMKNADLILSTEKLGRASDGRLIIEFYLNSSKEVKVKPEWFWITQNGHTVKIQNLILSDLNITTNRKLSGRIEILSTDIHENDIFKVELRTPKSTALSIRKVKLWS